MRPMTADEATLTHEVPLTFAQALEPSWLRRALAPVSGGVGISGLEIVEVLRTMATKVRFKVRFEDGRDGNFCLKAFLDFDGPLAKGDPSRIYEPDFYRFIAPLIATRTPACVNQLVDREAMQGVIIMRDLIVDGARFCTALEAFSPDRAALSLEQIALFHKEAHLLDRFPWIARRVAKLGEAKYVTPTMMQELLDGPRGEGLPDHVRNADALVAAMRALGDVDEKQPATLVHGDVHAGNIYEAVDGIGIIDWQVIQKGGWALDVAYHINAVLAVDVAEKAERELLGHYLEVARGLGCEVPAFDAAWEQYRAATVYGYFLWAMTRRVDPAITNVFVNRLGSAVARHDGFRLLAA
jgi:Phosphotransferase enzyme family